MAEWYENEKFLEVLGKGVAYGTKKFDEYQREQFKSQLERQKYEQDVKKAELLNKLKMNQYLQKLELDKQRDEYKAKIRQQEAEEMNEINLRALDKMRKLGYSVDDASKIIGFNRGRKLYTDTDAYGDFEKRYKLKRSEPSVPQYIKQKSGKRKQRLKTIPARKPIKRKR